MPRLELQRHRPHALTAFRFPDRLYCSRQKSSAVSSTEYRVATELALAMARQIECHGTTVVSGLVSQEARHVAEAGRRTEVYRAADCRV